MRYKLGSLLVLLVKYTFGTLLPTPGDTSWNSIYDVVSTVNSILLATDTESKFDKLCDEKAVGMGFALPDIGIMHKQLSDFQQRSQSPLLLCEPLVTALTNGINKRFEHLTEKHDVNLPAVVHPKFKLV